MENIPVIVIIVFLTFCFIFLAYDQLNEIEGYKHTSKYKSKTSKAATKAATKTSLKAATKASLKTATKESLTPKTATNKPLATSNKAGPRVQFKIPSAATSLIPSRTLPSRAPTKVAAPVILEDSAKLKHSERVVETVNNYHTNNYDFYPRNTVWPGLWSDSLYYNPFDYRLPVELPIAIPISSPVQTTHIDEPNPEHNQSYINQSNSHEHKIKNMPQQNQLLIGALIAVIIIFATMHIVKYQKSSY
jgi:hypothetical protein